MNLKEFFEQNPKIAIAFSGGVDSAYLLCMAGKYCSDVRAYCVKTCFQPEFELNDAVKLAEELQIQMDLIELDILSERNVADNPSDRCYYCKSKIMDAIQRKAACDGYEIVADGTNASDEAGERPGMRALTEKGIISPLRLCGLTKAQIREASAKEGLFTWNKPAYACLATRIMCGEKITAAKLEKVEKSEAALKAMGFEDFRVRVVGNSAKLQLRAEQMQKAIEERFEIKKSLRLYFDSVLLDLEER